MTAQLPATTRPGSDGGDQAPAVPALVAAAGARACVRFLEFFAAQIRNPHTRRAYGRAVVVFLGWCEDHQVASIAKSRPTLTPPENSLLH